MVEILKALAEENRLRILSLVIDKEMCVCEIEASLNMTQSNASRHLAVLKQSGILFSEKKAQWQYYRVSDIFKQEHKELFQYLQIKLKLLPTYQKDQKEYTKCNISNICELGIDPH